MSFFTTTPRDETGFEAIGKNLGAGLGAGFSQGISERMQSLQENKKNRQFATATGKQLGLEGEALDSWVNDFGQAKPELQLKGLEIITKMRADAAKLAQDEAFWGNTPFAGGAADPEGNGMGAINTAFGQPEGATPVTMPQQPEGMAPQMAPAQPQSQQAPQAQGLQGASKEQLIKLSSHPRYGQSAKEELRRREHEEKTELEKEKIKRETQISGRKEKIAFHQESQKFDDKIREDATRAKKQLEVADDVLKAVSSGNVHPSSYANIFSAIPKYGEQISDAFLNKDEAQLKAVSPYLIEGWREVFGTRLTDADLKVVQSKIPSIGKDPEANKAIVSIIKKYAQKSIDRYEAAKKIKEENDGLRPLGYEDMVEKEYENLQGTVRVRNPENGKIYKVKKDKLQGALNAGGTLVE